VLIPGSIELVKEQAPFPTFRTAHIGDIIADLVDEQRAGLANRQSRPAGGRGSDNNRNKYLN
jgi:hypothetical protein